MSSFCWKFFSSFLKHLKYNPASLPGLQRSCSPGTCLTLVFYPLMSALITVLMLHLSSSIPGMCQTCFHHRAFALAVLLSSKHRCSKNMLLLIMKTSAYFSRCSNGHHSDCFHLLAHITIYYFLVYLIIVIIMRAYSNMDSPRTRTVWHLIRAQ